MGTAPSIPFAAIVEQLRLAVVVFRSGRVQYVNQAARELVERLRSEYGTELLVILRDHLAKLRSLSEESSAAVTLLTAGSGESFYVHVMMPGGEEGDLAVSVRELGVERDAFRHRYRLSNREAQVVELVLRGHGNVAIAATLGVSVGTVKKHLTHIFDKIGVDSRTQLISRLA